MKTEEDDEDDESSDEFMEIDVKGTSHVNSGESNVVRTTEALDGDNPAYCREPYMKKRSSQELLVEAEKTFKEVTNLSLYDKLAVEHSNSWSRPRRVTSSPKTSRGYDGGQRL